MDWFEQLTGFRELTGPAGYEATRRQIVLEGPHLTSKVNGRRFGVGTLELVSLATLRRRAAAAAPVPGRPAVRVVQGDVRALHARAACAGALFQVASQFNLLEMIGPDVTPEDGVACYEDDRTQGPACAIAAGAATIYRNYWASVGGVAGQTRGRQLDGFAGLGSAIARALGAPPEALWSMRNGYALFTAQGVARMSQHVQTLDEGGRDALRGCLSIGLHWDVEVTDGTTPPGPVVSQAFCSALPVAYHRWAGAQTAPWAPLATLVLEAAYEATLWAAVLNAQRGVSSQVLLTLLGGGAFGNDERWIRAAIEQAMRAVGRQGLDIALVSFGQPSAELRRWARTLA